MPRQCAAPGFFIRATVTLAVIAAAFAAAGACLLAVAPAARAGETARQQSAGNTASVVIDSVSPQVARPNATVTVSGTVTNESGSTMSGLSIQLRSSAAPLQFRDDLASYADGTLAADTLVGTPVPVSTQLANGATASWRVSLSVSAIGIARYGVYPLAAEAVDASGLRAGIERTFLPFWPGTAAADPSPRLKIAWVWPLLSAPQQGICPELTSNSLASSIATGGRLGTLLATGSAYAASAHLTWAVDPGLLQSVATMTHPYRVGGSADCTGAAAYPASPAATQWLSGVRAVSSGQQMFMTPYDDVDVAALTHQGLDSDLTSAYRLGAAAASAVLGTSSGPSSAGRGDGTGSSPGKQHDRVAGRRAGRFQRARQPRGQRDQHRGAQQQRDARRQRRLHPRRRGGLDTDGHRDDHEGPARRLGDHRRPRLGDQRCRAARSRSASDSSRKRP